MNTLPNGGFPPIELCKTQQKMNKKNIEKRGFTKPNLSIDEIINSKKKQIIKEQINTELEEINEI
jgi:hypothetical protein